MYEEYIDSYKIYAFQNDHWAWNEFSDTDCHYVDIRKASPKWEDERFIFPDLWYVYSFSKMWDNQEKNWTLGFNAENCYMSLEEAFNVVQNEITPAIRSKYESRMLKMLEERKESK